MAVTITHLIFNGVMIYTITSLIKTLLCKPRVYRLAIIFVAILHYVVTCFIYYRVLNIALNLAVNALFCFVHSMLYSAPMGKRVFAAMFAPALGYIGESTTIGFLGLILHTSFDNVITESGVLIIAISMSNLMFLLLSKVLSAKFQKQSFQNFSLPRSYWSVFYLIMLGSILLIYLFGEQLISSKVQDLTVFSIMVLLLNAIIVLLLYMYNRLLYAAELKHQNILLLQQNEFYDGQSRLIQHFQQETSAQRHDMKNHLTVISAMVDQNQHNQVILYIDALIKNTNTSVEGINSGNTTIDAVVNSKLYFAGKQHTKMKISIELQETFPLCALDITVLLGNLLDNALEACLLLPQEKRNICLTMDDRHGTLIVEVSNTYDPNLLKGQGGHLYTSKQDKSRHGIGINNIKRIVEKYKGSYEYHQTISENGIAVFTVQILLYL